VVDIGHSSAQVVPLIDGFMLEPFVRRAHHLVRRAARNCAVACDWRAQSIREA
jgi:hypothetical protein